MEDEVDGVKIRYLLDGGLRRLKSKRKMLEQFIRDLCFAAGAAHVAYTEWALQRTLEAGYIQLSSSLLSYTAQSYGSLTEPSVTPRTVLPALHPPDP